MMFHPQQASVRVRAEFRAACALVVATALVLPGCKPTKRDEPAGQQAYELTLGGSVGLSVDYQTGKIAPASKSPQVVLSFSTKDAKEVLGIDCARLGGGSIAGRFLAYLGGTEVEQGEFQCLYQHMREVALKGTADTVKIVGLEFTKVIE